MKWKEIKNNLQIESKIDVLSWIVIVSAALYFGGHIVVAILRKHGIL